MDISHLNSGIHERYFRCPAPCIYASVVFPAESTSFPDRPVRCTVAPTQSPMVGNPSYCGRNQELIDAIVENQADQIQTILNSMNGPNVRLMRAELGTPGILRHRPPIASVAALLGARGIIPSVH
jgi:hypothetical protein